MIGLRIVGWAVGLVVVGASVSVRAAEEAAAPELHNVVQDPGQASNVYAEHADVASDLLVRYLEYLRKIGATEQQIDNRRPLGGG